MKNEQVHSAKESGSKSNRANSRRSHKPAKKGANRDHETELKHTAIKEGQEQAEHCIICANRIEYVSLSPCSHRTCHICTLRQRALFKRKVCLVCRSENENVIFSEETEKEYEDFDAKKMFNVDSNLSISFTSEAVYYETMKTLEFRCKICPHNKFPTFKALSEHVKKEHNKFFCLICWKNKKVFSIELELLTQKQLRRHQTVGDEEGFEGHPECKHCKGKRFYSEDELSIHIRDCHERCYICDQDIPNNRDYYNNYDDLFEHFSAAHNVCTVPSCLEKKFVVFRDELELASHMLKEHGSLTGSSGKLVVGSSGGQHRSYLSTLNNNVDSRNSRRDQNDFENENYDIKKRRLIERVRFYSTYNEETIKSFFDLNKAYDEAKMNASELLKSYQELFSDRTNSEISILLYDLAVLYLSNSQKRKSLDSLMKNLPASFDEHNFPILGGNSKKLTNAHTLGTPHPRKTMQEMFPALEKPKKSPAQSMENPVRYTTIRTSSYPSLPSQLLVNVNQSNGFPPLKTSSAGTYATPLPSQPKKQNTFSESKFPALEKKSQKPQIPRVNPVKLDDSVCKPQTFNSYKQPIESSEAMTIDAGEGASADKKSQKNKKKKEKILFQI